VETGGDGHGTIVGVEDSIRELKAMSRVADRLLAGAVVTLAVAPGSGGCASEACRGAGCLAVQVIAPTPDFPVAPSKDGVAWLVIPDRVAAGLAPCAEQEGLCLRLRVAPGHVARLTEGALDVTTAGGAPARVPFPRQQALVTCASKGGPPCDPPASLAGTPDAPPTLMRSWPMSMTVYQQWRYTAPAPLAFTGREARDRSAGPGPGAGTERWAETVLRVWEGPGAAGGDVRVQLPALDVDGQRHAFPALSVQSAGC
jgi:hypothetical protein